MSSGGEIAVVSFWISFALAALSFLYALLIIGRDAGLKRSRRGRDTETPTPEVRIHEKVR